MSQILFETPLIISILDKEFMARQEDEYVNKSHSSQIKRSAGGKDSCNLLQLVLPQNTETGPGVSNSYELLQTTSTLSSLIVTEAYRRALLGYTDFLSAVK